LAYFGTVPPSAVGLKHRAPPSWQPEPGDYAVSVNFVMGRPHVIADGAGGSRAVDLHEFGYFRFFEPVTRIGYSIDVYHLTAEDVAAWAAARPAQAGRPRR
jgi:hypothetical protein